MRTFEEYAEVREGLLAKCDEVELLWVRVRSFTSNTADFVTPGDAAGAGVVEDALAQVRNRLRSSVVEIGIFGQVKRGKSTLLNALLGEVVSSMRVAPETAVPVWVERGTGPSLILHADGTEEEVEDPADAREAMSQRRRKAHPEEAILRVKQFVDIPWVEHGLRIVDTPGLSDPSMLDSYEELTLAELDRVAAAIFVVSGATGIEAEDVRVLRRLGEHGVDKAFVVCNFWDDEQWRSPEVRAQLRAHILSAVASGATVDGELLGDELRVFEVCAKLGLDAHLKRPVDDVTFEASGVAELRREIEIYLAEGVLARLTHRCNQLLDRARSAIADQLQQRIVALSDRSALVERVRQNEEALRRSEQELLLIGDQSAETLVSLEKRLVEILAKPFDRARLAIEGARRNQDLEQVGSRLRLDSETAASKAASLFSNEVGTLEERTRRLLFESYGIEHRLALSQSNSLDLQSRPYDLHVPLENGHPDWGVVGAAAGTGAVATGLLGGSIAGGVGMALLAAGPVGWMIGAGLGLVAGALAAGAGAGLLTRDSVDATQRSSMLEQLDRQKGDVLDNAREACRDIGHSMRSSLSDQRDLFFGEQRRELERIKDLMGDEERRRRAVSDAQELLSEATAS